MIPDQGNLKNWVRQPGGAARESLTPELDAYKSTVPDNSSSQAYRTPLFKALQNGPNAQNIGENFFTNRSSPNSVPTQYSADPWLRFRNLSGLANRGYPLYSGNGQGSATDAGEGQAPGPPPLIDTYLPEGAGNPIADMMHGIMPSLSFISPLQTELTGVGVRASTYHNPERQVFDQLFDISNNQRLFKVDQHGLNTSAGRITTPHLNIEAPQGANSIQRSIAEALDHKPIPQSVYEAFENFDDVAKVAKNGGKALAAVGIAMDAYELGSAIYDDLKDEDGRLGEKTVKTGAAIGGSWVGGAAGAKVGAMGGAAIGTLICPGLGTVIGGFIGGIVGGVAGAMLGRAAGEYVVDQAYEGDW